MTTNEYLKAFCKVEPASYQIHRPIQLTRPYIVCADGFGVSIQASNCHYCAPRISQFPNTEFITYDTVELGFPSAVDEDLLPYQENSEEDPTESVYGFVPVEVVDKVLQKHGGIDLSLTKERFNDGEHDDSDSWWRLMSLAFEEAGTEFINGLPIKKYFKIYHRITGGPGFDSEWFLEILKRHKFNGRSLTEDEIKIIYDHAIYYYSNGRIDNRPRFGFMKGERENA